MSGAPLSFTCRVRIYALAPDGRRGLDPLAQGTLPCEASDKDAAEVASGLAMSATDGILNPPARCCVEIALWRGASKGAPAALNVDGPFHQRAAMARTLAEKSAIRLLRQPPPAPRPQDRLLEAVTEGALDGADIYSDLKDLSSLLQAAAAAGEPGAAELAALTESPMVANLLKDPNALALITRLMGQE